MARRESEARRGAASAKRSPHSGGEAAARARGGPSQISPKGLERSARTLRFGSTEPKIGLGESRSGPKGPLTSDRRSDPPPPCPSGVGSHGWYSEFPTQSHWCQPVQSCTTLIMSVHRPMIRPEIAAEIDQRRGMVPFQAYVNELLRLALNASGEEKARQRIEDRTTGTPQATPGHIPPVSQTWRR